MRTFKTSAGAMVLAMMLGLASCSSEEHITGGNEVA